MFRQILFSRNLFSERVLFLAVSSGLAVDGFVSGAFSEHTLENTWLRIAFIAIGFVFATLTWIKKIPRKLIRRFASITIGFFVGYATYLVILYKFHPDSSLTFVGAFLICSIYFRRLSQLLQYIVFGLVMACLAVYLVDDPLIDKWVFLLRLALGSVLIVGLSQATRLYQDQLVQHHDDAIEKNRELAGIRADLESRLTQEQLLSLVADRSNVAVIISDEKDIIEWVNTAFSTITGYAFEECVGKDPGFLRGPNPDHEVFARIQKKKEEKKPFHEELLNYRKDGTPFWMSIHVTPLVNEDGEVEHYIAIQEDISERHRTEEELRTSQTQLREAQRQAKIGTWYWDSQTDLFTCSEELQQMLGLHSTGPVSRFEFLDSVHPDDKAMVEKSFQTSLRKRSPFEIEHRIQHGTLVQYIYMTGQSEAGQRLFGTMQNITERKKIEEEMRQTELRFRNLFDHSQNMICTHDLEGNLISINNSGAHDLGYEPEELVGINIRTLLSPEVAEAFTPYLQEILSKGNAEGVLKLKKRNGDTSIWIYNNIRMTAVDGQAYVLGASVEITERYKMETELRQAKKMAEEALVTKDRFVANISHELRTPMNAILGFVDLLLQSKITEEQRAYLMAVNSAGENLTAVINDILDLAKIESGKIDFESKPYQLNEVMHNVSLLLEQRAKSKSIDLLWSCESAIPNYILGDSLRLNQVLINLVGNAIKFTEKGFVRFSCAIEGENETSLLLRFRVEDTGIGIAEDQLKIIFEPFTQASNDSTRKFGGTGLGLSISRDLVELQGGEILVESTLGKGSVFQFLLPVQKLGLENVQEMEQALQPLATLGKLKILLVEDHPLNQQLAQKLIIDFGFSVMIANNGREAVQFLQFEHFDVVLMDLQMPIMDGYEATRVIRNELKLTTPIIALTAHSASGERDRCLALGMNDYLSKPFRAQELYFRIASAVPKAEKINRQEVPQHNAETTPLRALAGSDWRFEKEMLSMLMRSLPEDFTKLKNAAQAQEPTTVKQLAHRLKSSAALIAATSFVEKLEYLESHATQLANNELLINVQNAQPDYEKTIRDISDELSLLSEKL